MERERRLITHLVAETIGLNVGEVSPQIWERVLRERLTLSGKADLQGYYQLLISSPYEFQELVERLIVAETWFFRDRAAFDLMLQLLKRRKGRLARLLSIPCATGEEPYSIAMSLLDSEVAPETFRIDAIDISKIALLKAEKGLYTSHSFRGGHLDFRARHFDEEKEGYQLKKEVRKLIHFSYGNIYQPNFAEGKTFYDLIFCRNLLIYLHAEAQKRTLTALGKLLTDEGWLIVAPAEASIVLRHGFEMEKGGKPFLLRKKEVKKEKVALIRPPSPPELSVEDVLPQEDKELHKAKQLADRGDFAEAEMHCRTYLERHVMDAEGYFLLGAISHARGDEDEAEKLFMKTVYLEPDHKEGLMYLALLAEKRGEMRQAEHFRRRIKG